MASTIAVPSYSDSEKDDPIHSRLSGSSIRRGLRSVEQGAQEVQLVASKVETTARFAEQAERNYEQQGFFQPDGAAGRRPRSASRGRLAEGLDTASRFAEATEETFQQYESTQQGGDGRRSRSASRGRTSGVPGPPPPPRVDELDSGDEGRARARAPRTTVSAVGVGTSKPKKPKAQVAPPRRASSKSRKSADKVGGVAMPDDGFLLKIDQFQNAADFRGVLDETQELLDDALEGMGEIKRRREELACAEYSPAVTLRASQPQKGIEEIQWKQKPSGCRQGSSSRPWDLDEDELKYLASLIMTTGRQIASAYKGVRLIKHRFNALTKQPTMDLSSSELLQLKSEAKSINRAYADCLDEVSEFADDERDDVDRGGCDARITLWLQDRNPAWDRSQVLSALSEAKAASKSRTRASLASLNLESASGQWILQNPFTYLDRTVRKLQLYQTGISSSDVYKEQKRSSSSSRPGQNPAPDLASGVYAAVAGVFDRFRSHPSEARTPPKKKKSKKSKSRKVEGNFYEIGKGGRKPHIPQEPDVSTDDSVLFGTDTEKMGGSVPPRGPSGYPSMAVKPSSRPAYKPPSSSRPAYQPSSSGGRPAYRPPSRPSSAPPAYAQGSDSESDGGAEMKQLLGPDGQPLQISQPIPTDDPDGDSETPSELLEDARQKVRNEHLFIPLIIFFWLCVFALLIYYGVAKVLGDENPLGDVDLGSHLGDDSWNDTTTTSVPSTTSTPLLTVVAVSTIGATGSALESSAVSGAASGSSTVTASTTSGSFSVPGLVGGSGTVTASGDSAAATMIMARWESN